MAALKKPSNYIKFGNMVKGETYTGTVLKVVHNEYQGDTLTSIAFTDGKLMGLVRVVEDILGSNFGDAIAEKLEGKDGNEYVKTVYKNWEEAIEGRTFKFTYNGKAGKAHDIDIQDLTEE